MKMQAMTVSALILIGIAAPPGRASGRDRPAQIVWVGSYEQALREARESGRPILICVNMDGEEANDEQALKTYHDPELVRRTRDMVPLIASSSRHDSGEEAENPSGRRPCPRFGIVTCDEHIAIERALRKTWFKGVSEVVAPQHIIADREGRAFSLRKHKLQARELIALMDGALKLPGDPRKVERFERRRINKLLEDLGPKPSCCGHPAMETLHAVLSHGRSELVLELLSSSGEKVRDQFLRSLPDLGVHADEALRFLLSDKSPRIRAATVEVWNQMPQYLPRSKEKILELVDKERNRLVRRALKEAVGSG